LTAITSSFTDFTPSLTPLTSLSIPCARSTPAAPTDQLSYSFAVP
jgi:hypothetical protein